MMKQSRKMNAIMYSNIVVVIWFFLFGVRLIGYFSTISDKGLRTTECGTQGCTDAMFIASVVWTWSFFIVIPLILPLALIIYFHLKKS
jgi:hypothetical protein